MLLKTPVVNFGWQAKPFSLFDTNGDAFGLQDLHGGKAFLIMFICNHCPYVKTIIERLVEDIKTLQSEDIRVAAIMSNDYQYMPSDSPEMMRAFAAQYQFSFPYLIDEDQSVGKSYDAVCTPDFFGFNSNGELQYRGRLDNLGMGEGGTKHRKTELLDGMRQIATTGHGPQQQVPSMGCSIKWRN